MFSIAKWSTLSNFNTYIVDPGCTVRIEVLWEPLVRVQCVLPTKPWSCGQPQQPSSAADIQFGHFITAAALISWPGYTWMVRSSAADNLPGGTGQQKIADRTTSEKPLSNLLPFCQPSPVNLSRSDFFQFNSSYLSAQFLPVLCKTPFVLKPFTSLSNLGMKDMDIFQPLTMLPEEDGW